MSELNFPKNPAVGQEYTFNSLLYMFDGVKWVTKGTGYNPVQDLYEMLASDAGASFIGINGHDNVQAALEDLSANVTSLEAVDADLQAQVNTKINADFVSRFDRESLRRSYADAGYNLVAGSFEVGGILVNANDVLLHEASGKAFSGPTGTVAAGTNPASGGFVDVSLHSLREVITPPEWASTADPIWGFKYNDASAASANTQRLVSLSASGFSSVLVDVRDNIYLEALPTGNESCIFDKVEISGVTNKNLILTGGGNLFTIREGGAFIIKPGTNIDAPSNTLLRLVATPIGVDTRIGALSCKNSKINGWIRFQFNSSASPNPAVKLNGVDRLTFTGNAVSNCGDIGVWLSNAMYDIATVKDNNYHNCKGTWFFDSIVNGVTYEKEIQKNKKQLITKSNVYKNDISFNAAVGVGTSTYVCFILWEGAYLEYAGNHVENVQAWDEGTTTSNDGVFDVYMHGIEINMHDNICKNRFNFSASASTNYARNPGLKIKSVFKANISDHKHYYDDGYFAYHAANGRVTTGILGDFIAVEHFGAGPADVISIKNCTIHSHVLSNSTRDGYFCNSFIISDCNFYSNGSGRTTLINAKVNNTTHAAPDDYIRTLEFTNNVVMVQNSGMASICYAAISASVPLYVNVDNNVIRSNNVVMTTFGMVAGEYYAITGLNLSNNKVYASGATAALISKFAVVPVMTNLTMKGNVVTAPNASIDNSPMGGVVNTSSNVSIENTFQTSAASYFILDVITGVNAAQPSLSSAGSWIVTGTVMDDVGAYAQEYPFTITYNVSIDGIIKTVLTFNSQSDVTQTSDTASNATKGLKVSTTHPTMVARVVSNSSSKNIQIELSIGAATQQRVVSIKAVKI